MIAKEKILNNIFGARPKVLKPVYGIVAVEVIIKLPEVKFLGSTSLGLAPAHYLYCLALLHLGQALSLVLSQAVLQPTLLDRLSFRQA